MVSKMGEHMAETQNKSALPKYKENKRNSLPVDALGQELRGEVCCEARRWMVVELWGGR